MAVSINQGSQLSYTNRSRDVVYKKDLPPPIQHVDRLSPKAYRELEASVWNKLPDLRSTDPGSLGIRAGAELVLATLRKDFTLV